MHIGTTVPIAGMSIGTTVPIARMSIGTGSLLQGCHTALMSFKSGRGALEFLLCLILVLEFIISLEIALKWMSFIKMGPLFFTPNPCMFSHSCSQVPQPTLLSSQMENLTNTVVAVVLNGFVFTIYMHLCLSGFVFGFCVLGVVKVSFAML